MKNYLTPLIVGISLIICCAILSKAYHYKFKSTENISVTGSAETNFESDQIVWTGNYSRKMMDLKSAYALLKADEQSIKNYLIQKGVAGADVVFSAISIDKEFNTRYDQDGKVAGSEFSGYNLRQSVTVNSKDLNKIEKISREVTELIESGIEFNSTPPSYYYSKLSDLKIDLLSKASADAKRRAETIAKNSGTDLGHPRKAVMGVFQITGENSNEDYSYGGVFNTSSRHKTASITVKLDFATN